ncbi:hypothetical protein [Shewanella xiamenensis]|uniref:hypothetical protein n=1 Tax=Shewanella xiamenensis TaxID=332186 RepID=UPI0024A6453D|nr:hypothetical protein [Shewanella xiamenensis]MDI5846678.1 hypothetical protein [Shewanella xiamenensis]
MVAQKAPKLLFIPVSSAEGIGEYMRSMIIADEVKRNWPHADIKFILSKHAPYAAQCPYNAVLLDDTPTKQVKAVNQIITEYLPDIVIFDASGRKSQLAHAHKLGAKVVFISQHKRKRSRGMKIGRALVTDCHWVVQPEFVIGPISGLERLKLKLINKPIPLNIGPVFTQPDEACQTGLLAQYQLTKNEFVLFNAGSGGHKVNGELAADIFAQAAYESYKASGIVSVMVFGPNYPNPQPELEGVVVIPQLNNQHFINLLAASKAAVLSGGDTLLQAIALHKPTLAVPVSKDQPPRIEKCVSEKYVISCETKSEAMGHKIALLLDPTLANQLMTSLARGEQLNGLDVAIKELAFLLDLG